VHFKSIDKREAYPNGPASPIQVVDYLKPQLIGIQNPEGQGVLREGNQDIVQKVGDFLPIEFEQEVSLANFGPHSAAKSAVLLIPNALWQLDSNNPVKPVFEAYIDSQPQPTIDSPIQSNIRDDQTPSALSVSGQNLQLITGVFFRGANEAQGITGYASVTVNQDGTSLTFTPPVRAVGSYGIFALTEGCSSNEDCPAALPMGLFKVTDHCLYVPDPASTPPTIAHFFPFRFTSTFQTYTVTFCGQFSPELMFEYTGNGRTETNFVASGNAAGLHRFEYSARVPALYPKSVKGLISATLVLNYPNGKVFRSNPVSFETQRIF
jgi:hypothetical protein